MLLFLDRINIHTMSGDHTIPSFLTEPLAQCDPEMYELIRKEKKRQVILNNNKKKQSIYSY